MTGSQNARRRQIEMALTEYKSKAPGTVDAVRIPFRGSSVVVEVIDLPLDVPLLNTKSFRIAPHLIDHPQRDLVLSDPESDEAQAIVAELVRTKHRNADKLKESLRLDGQDEPGLITRGGKLINGNSRCVLLRELVAEGSLSSAALRVAVLPSDAINSEELGLESTLQIREPFKDAYNLVSKVLMIETLHNEAKMSDDQIAASLRETPKEIRELREILVLMNRARSLTTPTLPISIFVKEKDQTQNWKELARQLREIEALHGREAGNDYIRTWLLTYFAGFEAVHQLRQLHRDFLQRDVLPMLDESPGVSSTLAHEAIAAATAEPETDTDDRRSQVTDLGLDFLAPDDETDDSIPRPDGAAKWLLDVVIAARDAEPDAPVELATGVEVAAEDLMDAVRRSVGVGIDASRRRKAGTTRLNRPQKQLENAAGALRAAHEAYVEVADEPEFAEMLHAVREGIRETAKISLVGHALALATV